MHCVLIHSMAFAWLKSVFLFAKNTRLYENRYRFFFTQCDSRLFVVLSRAQFVCLIRFKNETPLQGLMWKGTFLIISRSSLFTDWSQAGFNILMKLKRAKTTLKKQHETKPNQLHSQKSLSKHRTYSRNGNNRNLPSIIGFIQMCLATVGKKTFFISIGTKLQAIAMDTGLIKAG